MGEGGLDEPAARPQSGEIGVREAGRHRVVRVGEVRRDPVSGGVENGTDHRVGHQRVHGVQQGRRQSAATVRRGADRTRIGAALDTVDAGADRRGDRQVGVGRTITAAQFDALIVGYPDIVGAVVSAVGGCAGCPGRTGCGRDADDPGRDPL